MLSISNKSINPPPPPALNQTVRVVSIDNECENGHIAGSVTGRRDPNKRGITKYLIPHLNRTEGHGAGGVCAR